VRSDGAEDEWTILVYMNSDNNLECFGVQVGGHLRVEAVGKPAGLRMWPRRRLLQLPSRQPPFPPTSLLLQSSSLPSTCRIPTRGFRRAQHLVLVSHAE
jgi:hypothetical protein